jgi:hypothetical protein
VFAAGGCIAHMLALIQWWYMIRQQLLAERRINNSA